ncbi:MAG: hypothetical protein KA530_11895 [Ferruginibacter sp.]|nr:hypothetical protein [Ferruginibacter sp.]
MDNLLQLVQSQSDLIKQLSHKIDTLEQSMYKLLNAYPFQADLPAASLHPHKTTPLDHYTQAFFTEHNIGYMGCIEEVVKSKTLDNIVLTMGNHFVDLQRWLLLIKRNVASSGSFQIQLNEFKNPNIIIQVSEQLFKIAYLDEFALIKGGKQLLISPSRLPVAHNFFTGFWLERYIFLMIDKVLKQFHLQEIALLYRNMVVTVPDVGNAELDILLLINDTFFWIEIKSGDFQNYLTRYHQIKQELQFEQRQCILVINENNFDIQNTIEQASGFTVIGIQNFSQVFTAIIKSISK